MAVFRLCLGHHHFPRKPLQVCKPLVYASVNSSEVRHSTRDSFTSTNCCFHYKSLLSEVLSMERPAVHQIRSFNTHHPSVSVSSQIFSPRFVMIHAERCIEINSSNAQFMDDHFHIGQYWHFLHPSETDHVYRAMTSGCCACIRESVFVCWITGSLLGGLHISTLHR